MQKNGQSTRSYILLMLVSFLLMLFFAYNTSPLFEYIGVDSGMYLVIGKAMAQGKSLYLDLFDHKGPFIFVINMLPQFIIHGAIGVWFTEFVLMTIAASILYKIASQYIDSPLALAIPLIYMWVTITLFNGGNYTEEYSNFFSVIALFIFDKWLNHKKLTPLMWYTLGVCFALVFFIRPNNAALVGAILLLMGTDQMINGRTKILKYMMVSLGGMLTIILLLAAYHLWVGTLYEMLNATFLHNMKYCIAGAPYYRLLPKGNSPQLLCFFIALGINVIAMCTCYSSGEIKVGHFILLSTVVVSLAILISRHPFLYYWTLLAPLAAYAALFMIKYGLKVKKKSRQGIIVSLMLVLMCTNTYLGAEITEKKRYIIEYKQSTHEMYGYIPEDEKDNCFAYNMPAMFIYEVDLYTPCKYFTMQTWMAKINPDIAKYCTDYVKEKKPKWILSYYEMAKDDPHSELSQIVKSEYTQVFSNECGYLYKKVKD